MRTVVELIVVPNVAVQRLGPPDKKVDWPCVWGGSFVCNVWMDRTLPRSVSTYGMVSVSEVEGILETFVPCNIATSNESYSLVFALSCTEWLQNVTY